MNMTYQVAGHRFRVEGDVLCKAMDGMPGFPPFEAEEGDVLFSFIEGSSVPTMQTVQYEFTFEDIVGHFGRTGDGYLLTLKPQEESVCYLWCRDGDDTVQVCGNLSMRLFRFALWIGYGVMTVPHGTVAIHSSCIVYQGKAVLFLGESGTGKSTHTRLWQEHIDGAFLLNDDSPVVRIEESKVWVYGSPWSGKTPCYKQERYPLAGCVRLSQAPFNDIKRLSVLQAYGAIHPSCPPEFAYDSSLYDHIYRFIDTLISRAPFYHLACLPNREATMMALRAMEN